MPARVPSGASRYSVARCAPKQQGSEDLGDQVTARIRRPSRGETLNPPSFEALYNGATLFRGPSVSCAGNVDKSVDAKRAHVKMNIVPKGLRGGCEVAPLARRSNLEPEQGDGYGKVTSRRLG